MNILICGFMGSGKTTFVEKFSENSLGFMTFDLDSVVAESLKIGPSELGAWINQHGMEEFRKKEMESLGSLLAMRTKKLVALGGGTIEASGFEDLRNQAKMVFLNTPFEVCFKRIQKDANRPLTALGEEGLFELYQKRLPLYKKSDLTLSEYQIKEIERLDPLVHNLSSV